MRRSRLLVCAAGLVMVCAGAGWRSGVGAMTSASVSNPVVVENARPGTGAWRVREVRPGTIAGYASQVSVAPGDTLGLHVSVA
jgi:hypothetical protein